jgi:hypothetical protein
LYEGSRGLQHTGKSIYCMTVLQWISINFKTLRRQGAEVQFPCPKCKHESFYFNIRKKVGYCHHAKCGWKPTLQHLLNWVGSSRDHLLDTPSEELTAEVSTAQVELPSGAQRIVYLEDGKLLTKLPTACKELEKRGVSPENQARFLLHFDGQRVYVPVYFKGQLVNYVGRAAWWFDTDIKRYKYPHGHNIGLYLFNWDAARLWNRLTLVENTFNAIWLLEVLNCSTNFGSHLSEAQAKLITTSKVESVAILWDEGADKRAEDAVDLLSTKFGVPAAYCKLIGQPDDYSLNFLIEAADSTHEAARAGRKWISRRSVSNL